MVSCVEMEDERELSRDLCMVTSMKLTLPTWVYLIIVARKSVSVKVSSSVSEILDTSSSLAGSAGDTIMIDGCSNAHEGEFDESVDKGDASSSEER